MEGLGEPPRRGVKPQLQLVVILHQCKQRYNSEIFVYLPLQRAGATCTHLQSKQRFLSGCNSCFSCSRLPQTAYGSQGTPHLRASLIRYDGLGQNTMNLKPLGSNLSYVLYWSSLFKEPWVNTGEQIFSTRLSCSTSQRYRTLC